MRQTQSRKGELGIFEGIEYRYQHYAGSRDSASSFTVAVDCPSGESFKVTRETGVDVFGERLGVDMELQTGDQEFDDDFYLTTEKSDFACTFFGSTEKRQAIRNIFDNGFDLIKHDGIEMIAVRTPCKREDWPDQAVLEAVAANLNTLTEDVPLISEPAPAAALDLKHGRGLVFLIPIVLLALSLLVLLISIKTYSPLDLWNLALRSVIFSLPALVLYLLVRFKYIKSRSSSYLDLLILITMAAYIFLVTGAGLKIFLNGYLDNSEALVHEVTVVGRDEVRSGLGRGYHAIVQSWRAGHSSEKIRVPYQIYQHIQQGSSWMTITTKAGRFGYEWIVDYEFKR